MTKTKITLMATVLFLALAGGAQAARYNFYVDDDAVSGSADGSEEHPFVTISEAVDHIRSHNLKKKKIYVKNGTYEESITLRNHVKLYGESKSGVVIDADGHTNAVEFSSTKSSLKNITIKNSEATAVIVSKKSKATIKNCVIEKAGKFGIDVKASSSSNKYKFTLSNSEISDNDSQGLYISRRKISVKDNEIFGNDEEGIDLHESVKGTVSGNNIHDNGESGIESILTKAKLTFKKNRVEDNHTQGITVQIYSTRNKGKIKILSNTVRGNNSHGIRFANYTNSLGSRKFRTFAEKYVKLSKNKISRNGEEETYYE